MGMPVQCHLFFPQHRSSLPIGRHTISLRLALSQLDLRTEGSGVQNGHGENLTKVKGKRRPVENRARAMHDACMATLDWLRRMVLAESLEI